MSYQHVIISDHHNLNLYNVSISASYLRSYHHIIMYGYRYGSRCRGIVGCNQILTNYQRKEAWLYSDEEYAPIPDIAVMKLHSCDSRTL